MCREGDYLAQSSVGTPAQFGVGANIQAQADALAHQEAVLYCDAEPVLEVAAEEEEAEPIDLPYSDPAWLAERTDAERQETLLHRILKNLIAEGMSIRVAPHAAPATQRRATVFLSL